MGKRPYALIAALALCSCSGESSSRGAALPAAQTQQTATQVAGVVADAPSGTTAMLLAEPVGLDLISQGDAVIDLQEVDAQGRFALHAGERTPRELLISAPERALFRTDIPLTGPVVLEAQAVIEARVLGVTSAPEENAFALVVDADGLPLPLPALELVSGTDGIVKATRLPAGAFEVIVSAADGERHGRAVVTVGSGETAFREVRLDHDPELGRRFIRIAGGIDTGVDIHQPGQGGAR